MKKVMAVTILLLAPFMIGWTVSWDPVTTYTDNTLITGKTITYSNVVRKLRPVAMWTGAAMSVDLPRSELEHAKADRCAVLLQIELKGGLPGPILVAATIRAGL